MTASGPAKPTPRQNKHDELRLLVNSRHPIITIETPEEERVEQLLLEVAAELAVPLYTWSVTAGLAKAHGAPIYNTDNPEQAVANVALIQGDAIFLLKDFARYCDNDRVCRRLRELAEKFRSERRSIVITAASLELPPDLRGDGLLETVRRDASFADVAGLRHLRDWIAKRKSALTPEGRRFGLEPPKGILITGVQGCGKSLAARSVAGEWGYEMARLDAGALYDKFIGESEKKLQKALELAQRLAPMVLWIDEIEKAFASAGSSGDADAGLSQRLLATLLTWMQDRESGVFLAATSNNISALPPEMLRKGRFDEIFFVDLPNAEVRAAL